MIILLNTMKPIKSSNKKSNIKKYIYAVVFVVIFLLYLFISSVFSFDNIQLNNDSGYQGTYHSWNNSNNFNILVVYESKYDGNLINTYNAILSVSKSSGVSLFNIPSNIKIMTSPNDFQTLDTIYPLGNLNSNKIGMNLMIKYLRYTLALPIDAYISFNSNSIVNSGKTVSIDSNQSYNYKNIKISSGYNVLSLNVEKEILAIRNDNNSTLYIKSLIFQSLLAKYINLESFFNFNSQYSRFKDTFFSNISKGSLSNVMISLYKSKIGQFNLYYCPYSNNNNSDINIKNVDYYIRNNLLDQTFSNSNVSIQILDASNNNFAVYEFSRYVQNIGGNITSIGIYNGSTNKDLIYVSNTAKYSYEVSVLKDILGRNNVTVIGKTPNFFYTGTIVVVLGEDDNYIY